MALRFRGSVLRLAENYRVTCAEGTIARGTMCTGECCGRPSRSGLCPSTAEATDCQPGRWRPGGCGAVVELPILGSAIYRPHQKGGSQRRSDLWRDGPLANPCRQCGAWWGPPSGRSRHPHMALRFRGSVLRPAENYRVTCAGGSVARSATRTAGKRRRAAGSRRPTVRRSGWRIRAERGGARWGPQSEQRSATPHSAQSQRDPATAWGMTPCRVRRPEVSSAVGARRGPPRRRLGEGQRERADRDLLGSAPAGCRLSRSTDAPARCSAPTRRRGGSTRCRAPRAGAMRRSPGTRCRPRRRSVEPPGTSPPRRRPPGRRRRPRRG